MYTYSYYILLFWVCQVFKGENMEEKNLKLIGPRLKALRKGKNLSQQAVADFLGVKRPNLSKIENGEIIPTLKHILKLCEIFKVSTEFIIIGKQIPINPPDFREMNPKINEMLNYMAKNEALLHSILSHYYTQKARLAKQEHEKEREEAEETTGGKK
jgi:transcriptional regulator with XRE-family HTH domain